MAGAPHVLLIGAGGLVGRHLDRALSGVPVTRIYRRRTPADAIQLDITDHDALRRTIRGTKPNVIVLAAKDAYVERCELEPAATHALD